MISNAIWKSYKKEKQRACSDIEFRFLPGGEKTKNDNESPISFFSVEKNEKRKTKIKFVFHFPIQLKIGWH